MRVVLDTNILISAILFGGKSREILEMGISGKIKLVSSHDILKEFAEVLVGKKFKMPIAVVQQTIHEISEIMELIVVIKKINVIKRDPDDNRILECAASAKADYIISGDEDLLVLKYFKRIEILSPSDFLLINKL